MSHQQPRIVFVGLGDFELQGGVVDDLTPTGVGLILTEDSDPESAFEEAFVEIFYDAPTVVAEPEMAEMWLVF